MVNQTKKKCGQCQELLRFLKEDLFKAKKNYRLAMKRNQWTTNMALTLYDNRSAI